MSHGINIFPDVHWTIRACSPDFCGTFGALPNLTSNLTWVSRNDPSPPKATIEQHKNKAEMKHGRFTHICTTPNPPNSKSATKSYALSTKPLHLIVHVVSV